ncbi:ABC transporter permease [Clostridium swellfunianum]|uniref:ABC transporter permease n=1 Tax=Clostridium swellfunianum TaxID=1367462 RepID=UPI0020309B38|nr:ABC transporter permease [Clostridium swellfunianum]MCM0650290.1 ABC transporter permease [Clostridium swellfunianum]
MKLNPVLNKELKVKMRNWKAAGMIGVYLLVLTLVAVFLIINMISGMSASSMNREASMATYISLSAIQFLLIVFIAPALTSGAISGERERQTLDLMLCTKLRPSSIVLGKLFSSLSQVILLIVASFPIFAIVFVFGGISVINLLQLFLFYIVTALLMGCIGIFFSTLIKRTTTSNVVTYGVILFILFGTIFLTAMYLQIFVYGKQVQVQPGMTPTQIKEPFLPILYTNPLVGFAALLMDQFGGNSGLGIPFIGSIMRLSKSGIKPWIVNTGVNFIVACGLFLWTSYKINPVRKKLSIKRNKKTQAVLEK